MSCWPISFRQVPVAMSKRARMQGAFDLAVFLEALRQQGVGMRADVFHRMHLVILQIQADVVPADFHAHREIRVELIAGRDVVPIGTQTIVFHAATL